MNSAPIINKEKRVIIVIPVYQVIINKFEKRSLLQCLKLLKSYSIILIHPEGLNLDFYKKVFIKKGVDFQTKSFASKYFKNTYGYNELLLSVEFYQYFSNYEYLLLYQLDAFIFKNDLKNWCDKEYVFIGAPLPDSVLELLQRKYSHDFNKTLDIDDCAMNGGFSLRHIKASLDLVQNNTGHINVLLDNKWPEDVILVLLLSKFKGKLPNKQEAMGFSFESYPEESYAANNYQLPTGCHAWYRNDFGVHNNKFWFKHIMPVYYYKSKFLDYMKNNYDKNIRRLNRVINYINTKSKKLV